MENKYQDALNRILCDEYDFPNDFSGEDKASVMERDGDTLQELVDKVTILRPISEWCEELGDCLWWKVPIDEPPYCGSPLNDDFPWYVTHFTQLINLDWSDEDE